MKTVIKKGESGLRYPQEGIRLEGRRTRKPSKLGANAKREGGKRKRKAWKSLSKKEKEEEGSVGIQRPK